MKRYLIYFASTLISYTSLIAITPQGWKFNGSKTAKGEVRKDGTLVVSGEVGDGSAFFISEPITLPKDRVYTLRYSVRGNSGSGIIVGGTSIINKDITQIGGNFNDYKMRILPLNDKTHIRLGSWKTNDVLEFKDIEIREYLPLNRNTKLSTEEFIEDGKYEYVSSYKSGVPTYLKCEIEGSPYFNSNRWCLHGDTSVAYEFSVPQAKQISAELKVSINYNPQKINLEIFASVDGKPYESAGKIGLDNGGTLKIPEKFFPAQSVKIKIKTDGQKGGVQFRSLHYTAQLDKKNQKLSNRLLGEADITVSDKIKVSSSYWRSNAKKIRLKIDTDTEEEIDVNVVSTNVDDVVVSNAFKAKLSVGENDVDVALPSRLSELSQLKISMPQKKWDLNYSANKVCLLNVDTTGRLLPSKIGGLDIWQTSSANKLSRYCVTPTKRAEAINVACAVNERESVQIAFKKARKANVKFEISDLKEKSSGIVISAKNIETHLLDYVKVSVPTDALGLVDDYPDPIPQINSEFKLQARKVQPIWLRFFVPKGSKSGYYEGTLTISCDDEVSKIPINLRVFNFELPDKPTVRSAFSASGNSISRYYKDSEQVRPRLEREVRMKLSKARISPYNNHIARPDAKLVYPDGDKTKTPKVVFDWAEFDKNVQREISENNVNTMLISIRGIGGGNFHSRYLGRIFEIKDGDERYPTVLADYLGQLDKHIVEKGWQDLFYAYPFDEPEKRDYPFVINELKKIKQHAPNIKTMLTEEPSPELFGVVDIWCPVTRMYNENDCHSRQKAGEEIWWYICTQPRAPYAGEFIDHAGIDLRVWLWQTYKYGVDGILIWDTTYVHSPTAYPDSLQNPYEDPMSWATGYSLIKGTRNDWGNGDGRFIYPPYSTKDGSRAEYSDKIVGSMRLDILRDGIEDVEYFTLLKRLLKEKSNKLSKAEYGNYAKLLEVPETITKSLTEFSFNPKYIEEHRLLIADAIEALIAK